MSAVIDARLKEAETEQNLAENFNRILDLVDGLTERVEAIEESIRIPKLVSLTVGDLELSPEFAEDVYEYTASTTNEEDVITAEAGDETDTISLSGELVIDDDGTAHWESGVNAVTVTVANGRNEQQYTVTVTYTPPIEANS